MKTFKDETIEKAITKDVNSDFVNEVKRILNSGCVDPESHNRGLIYGIALENLADEYLRCEKSKKEYKNIKRF